MCKFYTSCIFRKKEIWHAVFNKEYHYNHSKFATEEHILIEGVIKDVFQGAVPDLDKPI